MDFGTNPTAGTAPARGKRQVENFGLITIELPNGMRLDGYILLSEKNAGKLGVTKDKLADLVAKKAHTIIRKEFADFFCAFYKGTDTWPGMTGAK